GIPSRPVAPVAGAHVGHILTSHDDKALDITNSFDSVSWPFLIEVMKWIADITGSLSSETLDHILVSCVFAREFCSLSGKGGTTGLFLSLLAAHYPLVKNLDL
ncbi:hypothetical protein ACJX0J_032078, partial [Zea mays]